MDERVWQLPGPHGFVQEIVDEHSRGRHVAVVLPVSLAADSIFTDSLAVALLAEFDRQAVDAKRVFGASSHDAVPGAAILAAFCESLVFGDDVPATIPELLDHDDTRGTVAVVAISDLSAEAAGEFPAFLRRVQLETHARNGEQRLSVVAILTRDQLPVLPGGAISDMTLTSIWWWGRIARWDVAAHIARVSGQPKLGSVLEDIRAESIVEVARWDLDLAEELAVQWSGDPDDLAMLLRDASPAPSWKPRSLPGVNAGTWDSPRPPESLLAWWNTRALDIWHERPSLNARLLATTPNDLSRVTWSAQARVLLPWTAERTALLLDRVKAMLAPRRIAEVLRNRFDPPLTIDTCVEIRDVDRLVNLTIGASDPELSDVSRQLRKARNSLAHLKPLSLAEQESLAAACKSLLA